MDFGDPLHPELDESGKHLGLGGGCLEDYGRGYEIACNVNQTAIISRVANNAMN